MTMRSQQTWPLGDFWQSERLRLLVETRWQPAADVYETAPTLEVLIDLAGVAEDDFDVQIFEDALVVEGHRRLPACQEGAVYQAASIAQGPFQVKVPLPASVDPERVETNYERGLLCITLPKCWVAG
jgi:HSP20 family protein